MEMIVAENLRKLMAHNKHETPTEAAKETKVSQQQIDRLLKGQKARVDTVEKLARAYGLEPYQMLIQGLDPANPQVLRSISPAEEKLYAAFKEAVDTAGKKGTQ